MAPRMTVSLRRLRIALDKAAHLSSSDLRHALLGQVALLRALRDVRDRPQGSLVKKESLPSPTRSVSEAQRLQAREVARGVSRAARYGLFEPTCLVRSMAIARRLEREGIDGGVVRVGVAKRDGQFVAHAWIEVEGEVIGDDASRVEQYQPLDDLQVTSLT